MTNYQDLFSDLTDDLDLTLDELTAGDNHNAGDTFFNDLSGHLDQSNEHPTEAEADHNNGDALLNELTENLDLISEERAVDGNRGNTGEISTDILDPALNTRADGVHLSADFDSLLDELTEHLGVSTTKHDAEENCNPDDAILSGLTEHLDLTLGGHNQESNYNTDGTVVSGLTEFLDHTLAGHPTGAAYFPRCANEIRNYNPPQVSLTELLQSGYCAARLHHSQNENAGFRSTPLVDGLVDGTLSRSESFGSEDGSTGTNIGMDADVSSKKKATLIEILEKALLLVSKE